MVAGAMGFINQTLNHSINFQKIIKSSSLQMTVNFIPSSSSSSSSSQLHTNNLRSRSIIDVGEGPLDLAVRGRGTERKKWKDICHT